MRIHVPVYPELLSPTVVSCLRRPQQRAPVSQKSYNTNNNNKKNKKKKNIQICVPKKIVFEKHRMVTGSTAADGFAFPPKHWNRLSHRNQSSPRWLRCPNPKRKSREAWLSSSATALGRTGTSTGRDMEGPRHFASASCISARD